MTQHTHSSNTGMAGDANSALTSTAQHLDQLITEVRANLKTTEEPKAQALFETTAEVLIGLRKAYQDYVGGDEKAWQ